MIVLKLRYDMHFGGQNDIVNFDIIDERIIFDPKNLCHMTAFQTQSAFTLFMVFYNKNFWPQDIALYTLLYHFWALALFIRDAPFEA